MILNTTVLIHTNIMLSSGRTIEYPTFLHKPIASYNKFLNGKFS